MIKLLIVSVTSHTPQSRVSDTITHVTLNTINIVVSREIFGLNQILVFPSPIGYINVKEGFWA